MVTGMTSIVDFGRAGASFIVVLGVLVFVHELGHYLAARWQGVHVEAFSIGFGPSIASWRDRLGTVWKLSILPLGGYVKLHGQERPQDVAPEVRATWQEGRTFHSKSVGSRAIIVAAGPVANFVLSIVLFCGLFLFIGQPTGVAPVFSEVKAEGPAAKAGLKAGDRVVSIDGVAVPSFKAMAEIIAASPDKTVSMTIVRDGQQEVVPVQVGVKEADGKRTGELQVGGTVEYSKLGPVAAVEAGVKQTWDVSIATVEGLGGILNGSKSKDELSGPLGIARLSGQVALLGFASLVSFIAVLSVNLGLVNLFPIPVLDGGHLMFYLAEALRGGRPLPQRIQEYGFRTGFALLAMLFLFATWNDISHWVRSLLG